MKWSLTFIDEVFVQYILVIVCSQTKITKNKKRKLTKIKDLFILLKIRK